MMNILLDTTGLDAMVNSKDHAEGDSSPTTRLPAMMWIFAAQLCLACYERYITQLPYSTTTRTRFPVHLPAGTYLLDMKSFHPGRR